MQEDPGSSTVRRSSWRSWAEGPRDDQGSPDDATPEPEPTPEPAPPASIPASGAAAEDGDEESFDIELTWPFTERPLGVASTPTVAPVEPEAPPPAVAAEAGAEWAPEPTAEVADGPPEAGSNDAPPSDDAEQASRVAARSGIAARRRSAPAPAPTFAFASSSGPVAAPLLPRLDARVASVESSLEGLSTRLGTMASSLSELSEVIGAIEGVTAAVADDVQAVRAEVVATRRDVAAAHDEVVAARDDGTPGVDELNRELSEIRQELAGLRKRLAVRVKDPVALDEHALAAAIAARLADSFELVDDAPDDAEATAPARRRAPLDARLGRSR
ncbi:MAG: hypothetical protein ABIV94_04750 [Acidimicrobiales bacterium]